MNILGIEKNRTHKDVLTLVMDTDVSPQEFDAFKTLMEREYRDLNFAIEHNALTVKGRFLAYPSLIAAICNRLDEAKQIVAQQQNTAHHGRQEFLNSVADHFGLPLV